MIGRLKNRKLRKNYYRLQLATMDALNTLQTSHLLTVDEILVERKYFMKAYIGSISGLHYYELFGDKVSVVTTYKNKALQIILDVKRLLRTKPSNPTSITENNQLTVKQFKQKRKIYQIILRRINKYYSRIDWTSNMFTESELNAVEIDDTFKCLKRHLQNQITKLKIKKVGRFTYNQQTNLPPSRNNFNK